MPGHGQTLFFALTKAMRTSNLDKAVRFLNLRGGSKGAMPDEQPRTEDGRLAGHGSKWFLPILMLRCVYSETGYKPYQPENIKRLR